MWECGTRSVDALCRPYWRIVSGTDAAAPQPAAKRMWVFCRTDYHLATRALAETAQRAAVFKEQRFSDHAPLIIDYNFRL